MAPPAFSWVIDGALAACAAPGAAPPWDVGADLRALAREGTTLVVTLTRDAIDPDTLKAAGLDAIHYPMEELGAPTEPRSVLAVLKSMQQEIDQGGRVTVHCLAGKGRTGTLIACFLSFIRGLTASQAIARVRAARPGSIESEVQEQFVFDVAKLL